MSQKTPIQRPRIRLVHWNKAEAAARAERLSSLGYEVEFEVLQSPEGFKRLRDNPPAAVVIDLGRVPSHGRDVGIALRTYKDTRAVPIVFVEGDPAKVEKIRTLLPDALYAEWTGIGKALERAVSSPLLDPVVPRSRMEAYSGAPLLKKLGIKPGTMVFIAGAPEGFEKKLGQLPEGVSIQDESVSALASLAKRAKDAVGVRQLILWFVRTERELKRKIKGMAVRTPDGGLWVIWPKKTSGAASDLNQNIIRRAGLDAGLVDYKICSVDETWSGLLFARRK